MVKNTAAGGAYSFESDASFVVSLRTYGIESIDHSGLKSLCTDR